MSSINSIHAQPRPATATTLDALVQPQAKAASPLGNLATTPLLSARLDQQVISASRFTAQDIQAFREQLDTSTFTQAERLNVMILADELVQREASQLTFDPSAWEKHVGVLVAAIVAVNISRQSSAQLRGSYAVMAAEAVVSQGKAIVAAGQAAMESAITGAAVAGAMALGGMALSLKGQAQKHADIKSNGMDRQNASNRAMDLDARLKTHSVKDIASDPFKTLTLDKAGKPSTLDIEASGHALTTQEQATLSAEIRELNKKAQDSGLQSALNEKVYGKNITLGQALSSMAMVMSTMLASMVRLEEYNQREQEVLKQSEQMIGKSMSDEASQRAAEDTSLLNKLLEVFQQINQSRNATANTIAGSVRA